MERRKVALVTGASSGFGQLTAGLLAEKGLRPLLVQGATAMRHKAVIAASQRRTAGQGREPSLADIVPFTISSSERVNVLDP
jgi:NADP-dependent 3-hydroxy acid dehydrogenase YdfG